MPEPTDLPERIQRELEEALREGGVDKLPNRPRPPRRKFRLGFPDPRPRNPGQLVLIGVACFLVAYLLHIFMAQLYLAAVVCVSLAIITHLTRPQGAGPQSWRGRDIHLPPNSWQERLYRIIYRTR
jgi:hypothetical protein